MACGSRCFKWMLMISMPGALELVRVLILFRVSSGVNRLGGAGGLAFLIFLRVFRVDLSRGSLDIEELYLMRVRNWYLGEGLILLGLLQIIS